MNVRVFNLIITAFLFMIAFSACLPALGADSSAASNRNPRVISLYMPGFLKDGPAWRTQVDRIRMDFTSDRAENIRREMMLAKDSGISAFAYNAFPSSIEEEIKEMKLMTAVAKKIGFNIIPFPAASMSENYDFNRGFVALKEIITQFVDDPAVIKVNGKSVFLIDSADFVPFSGWE